MAGMKSSRIISISTESLNDIKLSLNDSIFCDPGPVVSANMSYLSLHSDVFRNLFSWSSARRSRIQIYDVNIKAQALTFCLRNIRTPEREEGFLTQNQLHDDVTAGYCLYASRIFLLDNPQRLCTEYLTNYFRSNQDRLFSVYNIAYTLDMPELKQTCFDYINEYSEEVMSSKDVLMLDNKALDDLLSQDAFLVDEMQILHVASRWATNSSADLPFQVLKQYVNDIKRELGTAWYKIRFPLLKDSINLRELLTEEEALNAGGIFNTSERTVSLACARAGRVTLSNEWRARCYDGIIFDAPMDLMLHSLQLADINDSHDRVKSVKLERQNRSSNKMVESTKLTIKAAAWRIDMDNCIRFTPPVLLHEGFTNYVTVVSDIKTLYSIYSARSSHPILGVNISVTSGSNKFVSVQVSPPYSHLTLSSLKL